MKIIKLTIYIAVGFVIWYVCRHTYTNIDTIDSLISALAFGGAICTIMMQSNELELQRKELSETRNELREQKEELKGQKKEAEEQNKILRNQCFDSSFFDMVNTQMDIVKGLKIEITNLHYGTFKGEGVETFKTFYSYLDFYDWNGNPNSFQKINGCEIFDNYFRHLYRIIKSIDASLNKGIITEDEAKEYIGIVRSQLSAYELVIICYNGQTTVGEKFKELIIKYNLLKNIRENLVKYSYYLDEKLKNVE